jgi:hypothetical protein
MRRLLVYTKRINDKIIKLFTFFLHINIKMGCGSSGDTTKETIKGSFHIVNV